MKTRYHHYFDGSQPGIGPVVAGDMWVHIRTALKVLAEMARVV